MAAVENSHLGFGYTWFESLAVITSSVSAVNSLTLRTTSVHIYTNTHSLTNTAALSLSLFLSLPLLHTHADTHVHTLTQFGSA